MSRIVIATHNPGKAHEIRTLLADIPCELVTLDGFSRGSAPEETEETYAGNAILKARYYANAINEVVLADDSGLEVDALEGKPGVHSARYSGPNATDEDRRIKLLQALHTVPVEDRKARFMCAVAVVKPNQEVINVSQGTCEGQIAFDARGSSGFGYDPVFIPSGYLETFAELSQDIKNRISHRANALIKLREFLAIQNWCA